MVQPPIRIPCPASNRTVYNSGPEEPEHQRGKDTTSLKGTTNHNLYCASAEAFLSVYPSQIWWDYLPKQHLVQAEHNLRNDRTSRGRSSHHMLHSKICHVSNERSRCSRISKTVSPEHPLEGSDGSHHQTLKEHSQSRFPSSETAIEEANSGNDQPDYKATECEVRVMVFKSNVLGININ